ncbi:hypothetical protein ES703_102026 [subsurface metagenome]
MEGPVLGTENEKGNVSQKEHKAEGPEELGHHGTPDEKLNKAVVAKDTQQESHNCSNREGQQGLHPRGLGRE